MDEAEFRLRKLEDEKKEKQRLKKEQDMLKKMDRDKQIHSAVELKQMKIREVQEKLDSMNDKVSAVIKSREEQMKDKKAREDFERQHKMF